MGTLDSTMQSSSELSNKGNTDIHLEGTLHEKMIMQSSIRKLAVYIE